MWKYSETNVNEKMVELFDGIFLLSLLAFEFSESEISKYVYFPVV